MPKPEHRAAAWKNVIQLRSELRQSALRYPHTAEIDEFILVEHSLPVDIRHNAKINREKLATWAERELTDN